MYWRLTSKEKPLKNKGEIKVFAAFDLGLEEPIYKTCIYNAKDNSWFNYEANVFIRRIPTHWSYIDELLSEELKK